MKKLVLAAISFIILTSQFSCEKPGCFGKAGTVILQERALSHFYMIELRDNIDMELVPGDIEKIEITAPENILPNVQTFIQNDTLFLQNDTDCRWLRNPGEKIHARLFLKNLKGIKCFGSGNVTNKDTLSNGYFYIYSENGAGNIELTVDNGETAVAVPEGNGSIVMHGKSYSCHSYINPRGQSNLADLVINKMYLLYLGLSDLQIHVTEELDATIRYTGNVYYRGNPVITRADYFSSGRLIQIP